MKNIQNQSIDIIQTRSKKTLSYFNKFGITTNGIDGINPPPIKSCLYILLSSFYSFVGLFTIIAVEDHTGFLLIVASLGASTVLLFDTIDSPLAQPKNVIGGHLISAFIGVSYNKLFMLGDGQYYYIPLVGALSVSTSIMIMSFTNLVHPPGGATALIPIIGSESIKNLGFMYIINPIGSSICFLVAMAIILNNLSSDRHYPTFWF